MDLRDKYWLAGLLEGEGSFGLVDPPDRPNKRGGTRPVWTARLGQRRQLLSLLQTLRPLMGTRRRAKIDLILAALKRKD